MGYLAASNVGELFTLDLTTGTSTQVPTAEPLPVVLLLCAGLGVWNAFGDIALGHRPSKGTVVGDVCSSLVVAYICVSLAVVEYLGVIVPHRALGRRVERLAEHVGGPVVAHHATAMLDWLDCNWADHPPTYGKVGLGWHWIVPFFFGGRPVLLSVLHDTGTRGWPASRRIDVYVPHPTSLPLLDEAGVVHARALGFETVQGPAGVRFERKDNDARALAPHVLDGLMRCVTEALERHGRPAG